MDELYAVWQARLTQAFFAGCAGRPVLLFIDDDELQRIAPSERAASGQLVDAVRRLVDVDRGRAMFARVNAEVDGWQKGPQDEPPPVLPVLALAVLAATRMQRDSEASSTNYYLRLAQALLPGAHRDSIDRIRHVLRERGAFTDVAQMWRCLDEWLTRQSGRWGISTIRDHPNRSRIGYPLSQALVTRRDRAALTRFFAALELNELGVPAPRALLVYLQLWASRPRGLSDSFHAALTDDMLLPLLTPLVTALAQQWDGRIVMPDGRRRLEMRLLLNLDKWSARWAIPTTDGVEDDLLTGVVGGVEVQVAITRDNYSSFYRIEGAPPLTSEVLAATFRLSGSASVAEFTPMDMRPFAADTDSGGWVSVPAVSPYEAHVICATAHRVATVRQLLRLAADRGWQQVQQHGRALLNGCTLFTGVVFSNPERLTAAVRSTPGLSDVALPDSTARPRLTNGLPVARNVNRRCFLIGGEPDLLLPLGSEPRSVPASLDDTAQEPPFVATGFPIPLRGLGLAAGSHRLAVDGESITFVLVDELPSLTHTTGSGQLSWVGTDPAAARDLDSGRRTRRDDMVPPEAVLARRGQDETWIVHADGACTRVDEPDPPTSLHERVPTLVSYYFELTPPSNGAWLAQRRATRWRVSPIRRCQPQFKGLDETSGAVWRELAQHGPAQDPAWLTFVRAWECMNER